MAIFLYTLGVLALTAGLVVFSYLDRVYRELGRLDLALADIDKALTQAPDSVPALLERGNIRRLGGDNDGARQDWLRVAYSNTHRADIS